MNKKGFVKTLEAVFAIILVLGIIITLAPKQQEAKKIPDTVKETQSFILDAIVENQQMRDCIAAASGTGECKDLCQGANQDMEQFINQHKPPLYEHRCEICNTPATCSSQLPLDKSLYTDSRLVATNPARIIRIIFWEP